MVAEQATYSVIGSTTKTMGNTGQHVELDPGAYSKSGFITTSSAGTSGQAYTLQTIAGSYRVQVYDQEGDGGWLIARSGALAQWGITDGTGEWQIYSPDDLPCECCDCAPCTYCWQVTIDGVGYDLVYNIPDSFYGPECGLYKWSEGTGGGVNYGSIPVPLNSCYQECTYPEEAALVFSLRCCDNGDGSGRIYFDAILTCMERPLPYPIPLTLDLMVIGLGQWIQDYQCDDDCFTSTIDICKAGVETPIGGGDPVCDLLCTVDVTICRDDCCRPYDELFLCFQNTWLSYTIDEEKTFYINGQKIFFIEITCDLTGETMLYQLKPLGCTGQVCHIEDLTGVQLGVCDLGVIVYGNNASCLEFSSCDWVPICDRDPLLRGGYYYNYTGFIPIALQDENLGADFMMRFCFYVNPGVNLLLGSVNHFSPGTHGLITGTMNGGNELGEFELYYDQDGDKMVFVMGDTTEEFAVNIEGGPVPVHLSRINGTVKLEVDGNDKIMATGSTDWFTLKYLGVRSDLSVYNDHVVKLVEISE
jgi:hypothetical protein